MIDHERSNRGYRSIVGIYALGLGHLRTKTQSNDSCRLKNVGNVASFTFGLETHSGAIDGSFLYP